MAAYGDVSRVEAVDRLRSTFQAVRDLNNNWTNSSWVRTAVRLHSKALQREIQWFLDSCRLEPECQRDIESAMLLPPDVNYMGIFALDEKVDLFRNVFILDIRAGELGLLTNGQIPDLHLFGDEQSYSATN
jgi:hypothetical protein